MPTATKQLRVVKPNDPRIVDTRPLYVRRVPESTWALVHINAIKSRMSLQSYLIKIMEASKPLTEPVVAEQHFSPGQSQFGLDP